MKKRTLSLLLASAMVLSSAPFALAEEAVTEAETAVAETAEAPAEDTRPRTVITTDLECDDMASLLHLLLYSNDIDIAGILVSASCHHWVGDGEHTISEIMGTDQEYNSGADAKQWRPMEVNWIYDLLDNEYAEVYPNLIKHDSRYLSPEELTERTKIGNIEFEGDYREPTEGSDYLKEILLDDDMRTLYVQAWGGTNTVARALLSIEEEYKNTEEWDAVYQKVCDKLSLISFGDQDNAYENYIAVNWPDARRMYCVTSGIGYFTSLNATVPYREYFKPEWMSENIKFDHGALMEKYPLFGDGTYYEGENPDSQFGDLATLSMENCWLHSLDGVVGQYEFISEGDSPCWMYLIPVGLRGLENSEYGSWGGRMTNEAVASAIKEYDPTTGELSGGYSVHRWFPAFMNDWAARADWCVAENYEDANHQPEVTAECLDFEVAAGDVIELNGSATDPDGDELSYNWFVYDEASKYSGENLAGLDVWAHGSASTSFTVPADAAVGDYFNIVLEVTDNGAPSLTRYAQAIVTVNAAAEEEAK